MLFLSKLVRTMVMFVLASIVISATTFIEPMVGNLLFVAFVFWTVGRRLGWYFGSLAVTLVVGFWHLVQLSATEGTLWTGPDDVVLTGILLVSGWWVLRRTRQTVSTARKNFRASSQSSGD